MTAEQRETVRQNLRLLEIAEAEELQRMVWRKFPLRWLQERMGESPGDYRWSEFGGYGSHKWDGDVDPLAKAWEAIGAGEWVGIESAVGTGKTFMLSRVVFWFLDVYPDALVVTSAPKHDQLQLHLWAEITRAFHKFKKIRPYAILLDSLRLKVDARQPDSEMDLSKSWQAVGFVAGVGAEEQSATKAQGFHRKNMLIITEETPGMPESVMTAFKNTSIAENNLILAVGNPDSELDALHQFCTMRNVKSFIVSAYDHPNVVNQRELISGAVTVQAIERRKDEYGEDSPLYLSRVRGISPTQGVDSLIKLKWVDQCIMTSAQYLKLYNKQKAAGVLKLGKGFNAVGIDVANSEAGDTASAAFGKDCRLMHIDEFQCPNATHLAYNIIYNDNVLLDKCYDNYHTHKRHNYDITDDCIGVDAVGVGVATINAFKDSGVGVVGLQGGQWNEAIPKDDKDQPIYKFASLRAQMWWETREDFRKGEIAVLIQDPRMLSQIRLQLTIPRVDVSENVITIEKKENIKKRLGGKSPNIGDAIVYWNWMRKGYRITADALPIMG